MLMQCHVGRPQMLRLDYARIQAGQVNEMHDQKLQGGVWLGNLSNVNNSIVREKITKISHTKKCLNVAHNSGARNCIEVVDAMVL